MVSFLVNLLNYIFISKIKSVISINIKIKISILKIIIIYKMYKIKIGTIDYKYKLTHSKYIKL